MVCHRAAFDGTAVPPGFVYEYETHLRALLAKRYQ